MRGAWMLEASHVSRVPESGWSLPLPCLARPSVIVVELLENKRHQRDRSLRAPGWQSVEKLWDGGLKVPESRMVAIVKDATLRDLEGRLNSAFLGLFSSSCGPSFSGHGYPTQCAANTSRPRSDRLWLRELRVSQHFSTFYGSSVQAMDTQLKALPALLSSLGAFLAVRTPRFPDISRQFTAHLFSPWGRWGHPRFPGGRKWLALSASHIRERERERER